MGDLSHGWTFLHEGQHFSHYAALNYERVGGREFLITKAYQSRLGNTVEIHTLVVAGRWVEPEAPMSRLPSCECFAHHGEDKSRYWAGELFFSLIVADVNLYFIKMCINP